ncbi:DUF3857 domain-containing protein [Maribacter sp. 2308TA10-17]|uniref:DUF3857 domain-containing protein n=1 Tax=Maribacter sp. 2308TA10-17 TaxID=3386276 RepID=UPI0039BD62CE
MRLFFLSVSLFLFFISSAQEYQAFSLDKTLTKNADAVVRLDEMYVSIDSHQSMIVSSKRVVTVLNEDGKEHIHALAYYDDNHKINQLSAIIYNAQGDEIKKFKKKDFIDQSASGNGTLYSDNRVKYMRYTPIAYPYTVVLEKSYETSDTAFIPKWYFLDGYNVSTEKTKYTFDLKVNIPFRFKENNLEEFGITVKKNDNKLIYSAENLSALKSEPYAADFSSFGPNVKFALEKFHLKGVDGQASNWEEFGVWIYNSLLTGQDVLSSSAKAKVMQLVAGISDPKEKVKKVYDYVQNNTRYISVQLGIGGWQPISAEEVDRVKYGDCKGLTNYTMALLKEVGIESYYTVVYADAGKRDLDPEFPSLQGNHVFLNVPLETEEMWLECTNQEVPANYLGTFTDDRYVLKVTPRGGELVKSRKYEDVENKQKTKANLIINSSGTITGQVNITSEGIQYNQKYGLTRNKENELEKHYKEYWSYVTNLRINKTDFENDKNNISILENVTISVEDYVSMAGDRWLVVPNMFNRYGNIPKRIRNRNREVELKRGFIDEDEFIFEIPENMEIETLFTPIDFTTDFGEYMAEAEKISENKIKYKRRFLFKSGKYSKDRYNEFRDFIKQIARHDNNKIVLIKK